MATAVTKDLVERRVPQYLAVYIGVSWGLVEFFAFMEDRFLLSPHLTNLVLFLVALLLPSVAMFVYFHGRKGVDRWRRIEKVFIPLNVLVTVLILFTGFSGKELGAVTTTVTVEDEEGNAVERTVAKSEFRKTLLLFPPTSDSTVEAEAWLGYGVLNALVNDLAQDIFLDARHPQLFKERLRDEGFDLAGDVPRALKRKVARDMNVAYFVDGSAAREGDGYRLTLALNDAERGRVVQERTYTGPDLLALVDDASRQLRLDLELPGRHVEETPDMPVSEHTTESLPALRAYSEALRAVVVRDDYVSAAAGLARAAEADPTFADANVTLYQVRLLNGDPAGAMAALQAAMDHLYRLPERMQYGVKAEWHAMQQDFPKSFAAYEMWAELYPQDIQAQLSAAQVRLYQGDKAGGIEALERVVSLDPTRLDVVRQIGQLHESSGDPDRARSYYERYREARPEDTDGLTALAGLERRAGNHPAAREHYERALLLEPGDVDLTVSLANLDRSTGAFDEALAGYERALESAETPQQRYTALGGLRSYYDARGARHKALEIRERMLAEGAAFQPPVVQIQLQLLSLGSYAEVGRTEEALQRLEMLSAQLPPPLDALVPIGKMVVYETLERPDELAAAVAEGEAMLARTGMNMLQQPIVYGKGRLHEIRGEWAEALAAYEQERELEATDTSIPAQLGRCHRELGNLEKAEELMLETLRATPADGRTHYEIALVYERMNRTADAIRHLERALEIYAPADPDYERAAQAREKLAELKTSA